MDGFGGIISNNIQLSSTAARGFFAFSMREWQQENKKNISEISSAPPAERIAVVKELFAIFGGKIKKVLRNKEHESKIDEIMKNAFETYVKKNSKR